jgi:WD40 repeat protein
MPTRIVCPGCKTTLALPDRWRGEAGRCPRCKEPLDLPDPPNRGRSDGVTARRERRSRSYEDDRRASDPPRGLSTGVIVGIVLGVLAFLGVGVGVVVLVLSAGSASDPAPRAAAGGPGPGGPDPVVGPALPGLPAGPSLRPVRSIKVANRCVWGVAFGKDSDILLTGDGYFGPPGQVRLWKTTGESVDLLLDAKTDVLGTAIGPGDRFGASASEKGVHLFDLGKRQVVANRKHLSYVRAVAFSPGGQYLASSCDAAVKVWNLPDATERWSDRLTSELSHWRIATHLAFSPDDRTLAVGHGNDVSVYEAASGKLVRRCPGHRSLVLCTAYSPDGKLLASGSMDRSVCLWNPSDNSAMKMLPALDDWVFCVAFSPNSKLLAGACRNGTVVLWDTQGRELARVPAHPQEAVSVAFAPDGKTLASSGIDGNVCLWDVSDFLPR